MPSGQPNSESCLFYFSPHQHLLGESFLGRGEAVSVLLGQPFTLGNLPVCVLCLFLCRGAPLFVFDVCELKTSRILTARLVCALQIFSRCYSSFTCVFSSLYKCVFP